MALNSYPTKLLEKFAAKCLKIYYARSVAEDITNQDYEGEIKDQASILNVVTLGELGEKNYDGSNMTADDVTESNCQLVTDQKKGWYFRIKNYDKFRSMVKNPEGTLIENIGNRIKFLIDQHILSLYGDAGAGNRIGTDYSTGTVTIDASGNVTGDGTTFTSAMVGKGFKATGHTKWYRVKTYTNGTTIVIENDSDDLTSAYDGGAINAGASYTIEAYAAVQVTKDNIYSKVSLAQTVLDNNEIPEEDRFLIVSPYVAGLIKQSTEYNPAVVEAYRNVVQKGMIGEFLGFKVYKVSDRRLQGNSTDGWHLLFGHKSAITMAMGMVENEIEGWIPGNFGKAYKSLYVWGAKVADERRKALGDIFCKA